MDVFPRPGGDDDAFGIPPPGGALTTPVIDVYPGWLD